MKARDWFGLILRVLGLLMFAGGLLYASSTALAIFNPEQAAGYSWPSYLATGIVMLVAGLYFLRGAPHLERLAYPPDKPPRDDDNA